MPLRNAPWGKRLYLLNSGGTAFDLTGIPLRMQIRLTPDAADALVDMTTSNGKMITDTDPVGGVLDLLLTETDTAALPKGTLFWDIRRTDTGRVVCGGRILVDQVVTRD